MCLFIFINFFAPPIPSQVGLMVHRTCWPASCLTFQWRVLTHTPTLPRSPESTSWRRAYCSTRRMVRLYLRFWLCCVRILLALMSFFHVLVLGTTRDLLELAMEHRAAIASVLDVSTDESSEGELAAMVSFAIAFPDGFMALVDTYDVKRYSASRLYSLGCCFRFCVFFWVLLTSFRCFLRLYCYSFYTFFFLSTSRVSCFSTFL